VKRLNGIPLACALGLLFGSGVALPAVAAVLEVPLALDYRILDQAVREQVFAGPDGSIEVFADKIRCNTLVLAGPRVSGTDDGHLRLLADMHAQTGTPLGGRCWLAKSWTGLVETLQTAHADPESSVVSFRVVESTLLDSEDGEEVLPRLVQQWIEDYVHPRLGAVKIDLQPGVAGILELLQTVVTEGAAGQDDAAPDRRPELRLAAVRPSAAALTVVLSLEVPDAPGGPAPGPEAPLTPEELAEWDAAWQAWDGFATWLIKTLAATGGPELTDALAETLLEARYDLRDALAREDRDRDPVRTLFLGAWKRLAPLVGDVQLAVPGGQALPYAVFVGAGDALQTLDRVAPYLGLRLDQDSLRRLARILAPTVSDHALRYDTAVDPELRGLLGLSPGFEEQAGPGVPEAWISWLIPNAEAAQIRPELIRQLKGWVPGRQEIDHYLRSIEQLLQAIAAAERDRGKVPEEYFGIYDALLGATAWQESCWRQYVERDGRIEAIRSPAGSVGLMQVNVHVWRNFYDTAELGANIAYNARAGNEILVHYLVDYSIRKGEQKVGNDPDNLARATYAMYNGGPRHRARYRTPGTAAALKEIDNAFWAKYRAIQYEGAMAVKGCLGG
jgi:hypothetical protein